MPMVFVMNMKVFVAQLMSMLKIERIFGRPNPTRRKT
jgi:hypothetical protein